MSVIQIVGPSSAGKTTLINYINHKKVQYENHTKKQILIAPDYSRDLFRSTYKDSYETFEDLIKEPLRNYRFQSQVGLLSYESELKYLNEEDTLLICDGGSLGNTVYLSLAFNHLKQKRERKKFNKEYASLKNKFLDLAEDSTNLFLKPPIKASYVENDGFRPATLMSYRDNELDEFTSIRFSCDSTLPNKLEKRYEYLDKFFEGLSNSNNKYRRDVN